MTPEEGRLWREGLADRPEATVRAFPALDHLFAAGEGPSRPAHYEKLRHVDAEVIDTIAAWIAAL